MATNLDFKVKNGLQVNSPPTTNATANIGGGVHAQAFSAYSTPEVFDTAGGMSMSYSGSGVGVLRAYSDAAGTSGILTFAGSSEWMRIDALGNVAIGTTSTPSGTGFTTIEGKLIVAAAAGVPAIFLPFPANTYAGFKIEHSATNISGASNTTSFQLRPAYTSGVATGADVDVIRFSNTLTRTYPDVLLAPDGGLVGVGTGSTTPVSILDVRAAATATVSIGRTTNAGALSEPSIIDAVGPNASGTAKIWTRIKTVVSDATNATEDADLVFMTIGAGTLSERFRIDSVGNIGFGASVGTWAAADKVLDFTYPAFGMDSNGQAFVSFNLREGTAGVWTYKSTDTGQLFRSESGGGWEWLIAPSGTVATTATPVQKMMLSAAGNLGIGMTPVNKLDVTGSVGVVGNVVITGGTTMTATAAGPTLAVRGAASSSANMYLQSNGGAGTAMWLTSTTTGFLQIGGNGGTEPATGAININTGNNNVGIGTASPNSRLEVSIADAATSTQVTPLSISHVTSGVAATGFGTRFQFVNEDAGGTPINTNSIASVWIDPAIGVRTSALIFYSGSANVQTEAMRIDGIGNIGVNAGVPTNYGAGYRTVAVNGTTGGVFEVQTGGTVIGYLAGDASSLRLITPVGATPVVLTTNGTERLRITSAGGVSFGSTGTGYGTSGQVLTSAGNAPPTWTTPGAGSVTAVSVVSANGFAGTATATSTPAITLTTSISGMLKGSSSALVAATVGTDYSAGTAALGTGILKSTTTTGALTIAVAADFPTLNQNTTGNAATATGASGSNVLRFSDGTSFLGGSTAIPTSGSRSADLAPNTYANCAALEFKNSSLYSNTGTYTGLLTIAPWLGTSVSTGDSSYQLSFNPTAANSTAAPVFKIRAGIDTTWGAWSTIIHSSNTNLITSTGTVTSGTWSGSFGAVSGANLTNLTAANLTGTTLPSSIVTSSLTTVGTVTSGTWSGLFGAVTGANLTNLTAGNLTGTISSTVLGNSSFFLGTTGIALNRASATGHNIAGLGTISASGVVSFTNTTSATTASTGALVVSGGIGCVAVYASGDVTAFSDARIKTNVEIIPDALNKVCQIRGVTYTRTDNGDLERGKRSTGVIAQEVEAVLPEAVVRDALDPENGTMGVNYGNLAGLLIEAIKELRQENLELKARLAMLEAKEY